MDEFLLELQAKLDEAKSKDLINADIEKIQQQVDKLKLQAEVDPKSISNIARQLESVIGEKITIGLTANIDNNAMNQIKKASDSATNAVIHNEKKKQQAIQETALISETASKATDLNGNQNIDKINADIKTAINSLNTFASKNAGFDVFKTEINGAEVSLDSLITKLSTVDNVTDLSTLKSQATALKTSFTELRGASDIQIDQTIVRLNNQLQNNTKYSRQAKEAIKAWISELESGVPELRLKEINVEAKKLHTNMVAANKAGGNFFDNLKSKLGSLSTYLSAATLLAKGFSAVRNGISSVTALDTALVDLRKTANMTTQEMEDFYYASNDVAKKMGVTTESILTQAAAWSRLGFNTAEMATQMAKLSSQFKTISPGMTTDDATTSLVSIMKAYDIEVNDVLDGIMSKINDVGNKFATSNAEIAEGLRLSSAAMASTGATIEDNIALFTGAQEIVQNASQVGNAIRSISLRIRGFDEDTEELSDDLVDVSGKVANLTKVASNGNLGISLFTDSSQTQYKSLVQYLGEISDIWDELDQKTQNDLLEKLFGKNRAQVGAAIIQNMDAVRKSMDVMANSAGSADREMSIAMDSIGYKMNTLKETGTGIAQNLFGREEMKTVLDGINSLGKGIDWLTDKLGLFGTLGAGAGLFAGIKNVGGCENAHSHCFELPTIICVLWDTKVFVLSNVKYTWKINNRDNMRERSTTIA